MTFITENWRRYFDEQDEGLGTTYERFILHRYFEKLRQEYVIQSVLETPSFGMTGVSGINSLWWASQRIDVTVIDNVEERLRLVEKVKRAGLKAKPEVGIQFGAGGASTSEELEAEGTRDPEWAIAQAKRFLGAGAHMIMIESEGITENVKAWRTDVPAKIVDALSLEKVMFEAADPEVFAWYVKNYGPEVNLFVDHSQIVQLECLRSGIWGTKSLWGRVQTYKG